MRVSRLDGANDFTHGEAQHEYGLLSTGLNWILTRSLWSVDGSGWSKTSYGSISSIRLDTDNYGSTGSDFISPLYATLPATVCIVGAIATWCCWIYKKYSTSSYYARMLPLNHYSEFSPERH